MVNLVSLHNKVHQDLKVCPEKALAHGADLAMVPVMLSEFLKLAVQYPIALSKNKETGKFVCVSLLGFSPGENLFWNNGTWEAVYVPLQIARQPFFLGQDNENHCVCFDANSDSLQGSEALFDSDAKETAYLQKIKSLLAELLDGENKTQAFVNKLLSLDLLEAMSLDITFNNGESHRVNGLYTIDEVKLKALNESDLIALHAAGYLDYIFAIIVSTGQIYSLVQKKNTRLSAV